MHSSPEFRSLKAKIRVLCKQRRIRLEEFMKTFDIHRVKKIKAEQFRRALDVSGLHLSSAEVNLLVTKYRIANDPSFVDYRRFCDLMDKVFTVKGLEANPSLQKGIHKDLQPLKTFAFEPLTPAEEDTLTAVKKKLLAAVMNKGIVLKDVFHDFDRSNAGKVTRPQFVRDISDIAVLSSNEMDELERMLHNLDHLKDDILQCLKEQAMEVQSKNLRQSFQNCSHGERYINYVTFCYDLENWGHDNQRSESRPSSRSGVGCEIIVPAKLRADTFEETAAVPHVRSVPMLIRYIKQTIKRDRIRLEEYYRDFDKLRHGKITAPQFCAGLDAAGFLLSRAEMSLLSDEYACKEVDSMGKHWIAWKAFVDDVESVFTVKGLEQNPHHDLKTLETREGQFGGVVIDKDLTPAEEDEVKRIMLTMKRAIDRQRMEIKPAFEDFDRSKQGFISSTKFERVLSMFNLLPAQASDTRLLVIKFREQAAIGTSATLSSICDVNYRAFLEALKILGGYTKIGSKEDIQNLVLPGSVAFRQELYQSGIMNHDANRRRARDNNAGVANLPQLLAELRRQLSIKRIRLKEFIVEGDKLRSGEITVAKFHTALNRSGCVLDAADIQTLSQHYRSARNPDKIDWRTFLAALDFSHGVTVRSSAGRGEEQPQDCWDEPTRRVLERLRNEVNHRRLHMKPYFQDYDHNNVNHVTKFQFAAVLDMMNLSLKPAEVKSLTQQFAHRDGRKITNDVNYLSFIQAVDSDYS
ncbi:hypothetical protein PHMEG_000432 [Phytophthora megakarya]|uniref:EF-hand domain-containing protein n=1 Tax=Phytophthora megakarya TaxID=4795 RepID=A0A225X305_9STRA|nr:hypothetical protein PHMEG_000432 [Phytophthora megakarya]